MAEESFVERVRKAAELAGGQLALSKKTGISARTINSYALGESDPSRLRIAAIAKAANVSAGWLVTGEGPMKAGEIAESDAQPAALGDSLRHEGMPQRQPCVVDESGKVTIPRWVNPDPEMFDYIPMADAKLSAGGGCFVLSEDVEGYYAFRKNWLSRVASSPKNLVLMRVHGGSMSPTLQDGDTVMIDTGRTDIKEGMLYALRFDSTIMVKRLAFRPGSRIQIISDNRLEYESYEAELRELHIIGQIIFFCRTFIGD